MYRLMLRLRRLDVTFTLAVHLTGICANDNFGIALMFPKIVGRELDIRQPQAL